jgi:class 3 adenylate cyclase
MNFNFMLLGIAFAVWLLQLGVAGRLVWLEVQIYKPLKKQAVAGVDQMRTAAVVPQGTRMSLLREYAASKHLLSQAKKDLAFLSIDVVGSTKMKIGEDQITIEHAFAEYKKFLERIFRDCRCWKVAWTPDGVMTCFLNSDDAATAGRRLLTELEWFNSDVHQLRTKFHVRCGMNAGEVMFPDEKSMEEISDEVIDVAGHMQKYADHDTLWVSGEVFKRLSDQSGFERLDKQVDNRETFAWRPGSSPAKE